MKTIINIIYPVFVAFAFGCFALLPQVRAVTPAPDGCYAGFTTAEGCNALNLLTTGAGNTGLGWGSLQSDTSGSFNTGVGAGALILNNGDSNTAVGAVALLLNTTGTQNTAVGTDALVYNDTGSDNTANGAFALFSNTEGTENTATGWVALYNNTTAGFNTATGSQALNANTTGDFNTAHGHTALVSNTTGGLNTAVGSQTLFSNTIGSFNTAIGFAALNSNDTGSANTGANTAIGAVALVNSTTGEANTAVGESALVNSVTGDFNIALGYVAAQNLTDGSNNIAISNPGVPTESNTVRIGNVVPFTDIYGFPHAAHTAAYIAGISGTPVVGDPVVVDANGQLGTATSSARFKKDIKPMDSASEAVLALKPVTFQYKSDNKRTPQFGLIAEEVAKVNPDLVVRDHNGEIYSVRYEAVNAMLLNEFLKAHQKIEEQEQTIAQLKSGMAALVATVKEQGSQIQKVSADLELQKAVPETAANQ